MRHGDDGVVNKFGPNDPLDDGIGFTIDTMEDGLASLLKRGCQDVLASRFVQHENSATPQHCSSQAEQLFLSMAEMQRFNVRI
jgi:hypothetical protein